MMCLAQYSLPHIFASSTFATREKQCSHLKEDLVKSHESNLYAPQIILPFLINYFLLGLSSESFLRGGYVRNVCWKAIIGRG